ncbi:protein ELYS [Pelodytes ibericus]
MQNQVATLTSSLLHFSVGTVKALEEDEINLDSVLRGKFAIGRARLAWLAYGPQLEVTNSFTGERLSAYHFSGVTEQPPNVVAVKPFSWQKKTGLLVGLVETEGSVLCLYDVGISRVVKAVVIPGSVTAVEPIINHGGASASTHHLHPSLRWFFGVAAVVTDVGHVLLIDLCLDDASNNQDELDASDLEVISGIPAEIPKLRETAIREHRHLSLELLAPSGTTVSTLSYIRRTNQLAVGFSDGYLSLWNLKTLRREYHVQIEGGKVPVFAVIFQEPENDPRNCCYLWAVQTSQSGSDVSLHMLQMAFGDRKCLASGQILYENLEYCEERYSLDLAASSLSVRGQVNSLKMLSCQTIEKFRYRGEREDGVHEVTSPDTSVSIFSWQVNFYGQCKPSFFLGVFDINRWYQAQMPDSLRPGQFLRNCSYFAFWSLETLVNMTQDSILDVVVHERSLSRGVPPPYPPPEQFYFPSNYNFDTTCLLTSGVVHMTCTGFQKETLRLLRNAGSSLIEAISECFNKCLVAGLLSPTFADVQPSSLSQEEQLQAVLSAAIETSTLGLLTSCVKQWTSGEQPRSAAYLRFVLEWTWNKVTFTKQEFDRLCVPLFDGSCNFIDPQTLQLLQRCHLRFSNLAIVLKCFIAEAQELTGQGLINLTNKQTVAKLLTLYASVTLWFCRCGLLPDSADETMQLTRPCYNYQRMLHYYSDRRNKMRQLSSGKWNTNSLMIDGMVCQFGDRVEQLWSRDGNGTGKYPPASLHALLDLYLLENVDEMSKHAITIYFLLDVMYSFPDKPDSSIESFPTIFSVPFGLIKLIQGFWLLDHNDYQNSLDCILHPSAHGVMTWQHSQIIETLMCQGNPKQAVRYLQVMKPSITNSQEVKLHMTVLLANRLILEAFNLQRLHSSRNNIEELLKHMFGTCQEMKLMEDLLKLKFSSIELEYLHRFLQTGDSQNQELLLVHHLQRSNYIPALQLNESLKLKPKTDFDRRLHMRAVSRNAIVDQYRKVLPRVQLAIAEKRKPYSSSSPLCKKVSRPKPLSTVIKQAEPGNVITKAHFINVVLSKIKEISAANDKGYSPYKSFVNEDMAPIKAARLDLETPNAFVGTPIFKSRRVSRLRDSVVYPVMMDASPVADSLLNQHTPLKSPILLTSSPVQSSLRKIAQLRSAAKASEFTLLETPLVVRRARTFATNTTSAFPGFTPQSILRSSVRTTPLGSPSVSPGRSLTPPLRPKETKISFMEEIESKYTRGTLASDRDVLTASPVLKSAPDTVWSGRLTENTPDKDHMEMEESSSGVHEENSNKMEVSKEISNVSARSDQTTLEYHDAPTPEDLEDDVVTISTKAHSPLINKPVEMEMKEVLVTEPSSETVLNLEKGIVFQKCSEVEHVLFPENGSNVVDEVTSVKDLERQQHSRSVTYMSIVNKIQNPSRVVPSLSTRDKTSLITMYKIRDMEFEPVTEYLSKQLKVNIDHRDRSVACAILWTLSRFGDHVTMAFFTNLIAEKCEEDEPVEVSRIGSRASPDDGSCRPVVLNEPWDVSFFAVGQSMADSIVQARPIPPWPPRPIQIRHGFQKFSGLKRGPGNVRQDDDFGPLEDNRPFLPSSPEHLLLQTERMDTVRNNLVQILRPIRLGKAPDSQVAPTASIVQVYKVLRQLTREAALLLNLRLQSTVISIHDTEDIASTHSEKVEGDTNKEVNGNVNQLDQHVLMAEETPAITAPLSHCVEIQVLREKHVDIEVTEPFINYKELYPAADVEIACNIEHFERQCNSKLIDAIESVDQEMDDPEGEHFAEQNNFTLVLEGDVGEEDVIEMEHGKEDNLRSLEAEIPVNVTTAMIEDVEHCESEVIDDVDPRSLMNREEKANKMEMFSFVPETAKVAIDENLIDAIKDTSKEFTADIKSSSLNEETFLKFNNSQMSSETSIKSAELALSDGGNSTSVDEQISAKTTYEESIKSVNTEQVSSSEPSAVLVKPPTPRRSIRKASNYNESVATDPEEISLPTTPRRGRKAKETIENRNNDLATLQEDEVPVTIKRITRKGKNMVPENPGGEDQVNTEHELTVELLPEHPPTPTRARRGKLLTAESQINSDNNLDEKPAMPQTPTRNTRSKNIEPETVTGSQNDETNDHEAQVTTVTRGRRSKHVVNELVKHFELSSSQSDSRVGNSPPVSPKKLSLRWTRNRSGNKMLEEEFLKAVDQAADTPRKRARKSVRKIKPEIITEFTDATILEEAEVPSATNGSAKKGNVSIIVTQNKSAFPTVSEESLEERLHLPENLGKADEKKSTLITRTRSSQALSLPDVTAVSFVFSTPTMKIKKKGTFQKSAVPVSPEEMETYNSSKFVFSPPSTRTRRRLTKPSVTESVKEDIKPQIPSDTGENDVSEVPVRRRKGRPPKRQIDNDKSQVKVSWSPPPVEIQLLSPPESPTADAANTKSLSNASNTEEKNILRRNRRRIMSKPVTRRKLR